MTTDPIELVYLVLWIHKARDFDLFVIKLLHSNCTFVLTPENESFPRKGIYNKISSKRNRNVTLALKCMAN